MISLPGYPGRVPTSNPYPERAIASFLLVGAMGVVLLFVGTPAEEAGARSNVIAEERTPEPKPRPSPVVPDRLTPAVVTVSPSGPVFSEAAVNRRAETPATPTSAAPEPTQAGPTPDPVPTPAPELRICPLPLDLLNKVVCTG